VKVAWNEDGEKSEERRSMDIRGKRMLVIEPEGLISSYAIKIEAFPF